MAYQSRYTALAWDDAMTAAVYFDRVIPAHIPDTYAVGGEDPIYYRVLQEILPETLLDASAKIGVAKPVTSYVAQFLVTFPQAAGVKELSDGETLDQRRERQMPEFVNAFANLVQSSGVSDIALYGVPLSSSGGDASAAANPSLILSNLDLVDTKKLTWNQVIELRKDQDAVEKLRNLRRMVYKDYSGKSEAYIREDIEQRLYEYEQATKLWGFPLQKGVLEIAMTGEALTAVGAVVALTLFGAPVAAAAAAGGAIAVGKAALAIANRKRDIEIERRKNPMAYLVRLKQLGAGT